MDELDVVLRARRLSKELIVGDVGLPLRSYLKAMKSLPSDIVVRLDDTLGCEEAGYTTVVAGKRCIIINANDSPERQRFTACHELAHILLGLPTEHTNAGAQFTRRSQTESFCDVFAAELLLPCHLFQPRVLDSDFGFEAIEQLAADFVASLTATGSRFAAVCDRPCAFVLAQDEVIRYASCSTTLRQSGGWIRPKQHLPDASLAAQLIRGTKLDGPIDVNADEWFDGWKRGGVLQEDARHFPNWNQTLALLWFEHDHVPSSASEYLDEADFDEAALQPLDGVLPWPSKSRRRP